MTISVTDVVEPPGKPDAPQVSAKAGTTDSLDVIWSAPGNTGPDIEGYNVQYRVGSSGNFTSHPFSGTGTSTTITGLAADTGYEVQVQAHNDEGDSPWSDSGTARTNAPVSSAATLSGLELSGVTFTPTFAPGETTYTADVPYTVTSTKVTATPTVDTATVVIKRNGFVAADGTVYLVAGHDTVITVEVTAGNTTNTYTVTVARAQVTLSGTALVSNIGQDSSSATFLGGNEWVQSFTTGANADGYNLSSVELVIAGLPAQTLTSSDLTVAIWSATDATPPLPGSPLHTLDTPAADTIGIVSFSASSVTLDPATTYFVRLTSPSGRSVLVDRTASADDDSGGAQGWSIGNVRYYRSGGSNAAFENSNNTFKIAVKGSAVSGTQTPPSSDATLSGLSLSGVTLSPAFASDVETYPASVDYGVASTTVTATTNHASATFDITPADADADTAGHQVALTPGRDTVITVAVTAEDGSDKTYTVTVTRARATVIITADAAEAGEGVALSFTVSRNPVAADELEVKLDVSETGTFVPPGNEGMKTVTIPANTASAKHTVTTDAGDGDWDAHSTVTVALVVETDSPYTLGALNSAQTQVLDDDFPTATAELAVDPNPVTEGGTVTVTVTVTTGSDQMPHADGGAITLSTAAGTAQTADYGALSETTLTLAQGDFSAVTVGGSSRYRAVYTATVSTVDDATQESDEAFSVSMARGSDLDNGVTLVTPTSRSITITANDAPVLPDDATLSGLAVTYGSGNTPATLHPGFASATKSYRAAVVYSVEQVTVTPTANAAAPTIEYLDGSDAALADADAGTTGHQVTLAVGLTTFKVKVTDGAETETYRVVMERDSDQTWGWTPTRDFNTLVAAGNRRATGIGGNATTLWVADDEDDKIYAYTLATGLRDTNREFNLPNFDDRPRGMWSISTTLWVADEAFNQVFAFALATGNRNSGSDVVLNSANTNARGIWSDGTTLWVADSTDDKIYAYALSGGKRQDGTDGTTNLEFPLDSDNANPYGIWSDGTTMWVLDSSDAKAYAYALSGGTRQDGTGDTEDLDFDLYSANGNPTGIWSVGTTLWVVDPSDDKIYSYNAPEPAAASDVATLSKLLLSGVTLSPPFASGTIEYTADVANSVSSTTVRPTPTHAGAEVVIKLGGVVDDDGTVPLAAGANVITVEVTAQDGVTTKTYTVTVTRAAAQTQQPDDATLSDLSLSGVTFTPTFASGIIEYTAAVASSVSTATTVRPTPTHPDAQVVIKLGGVVDDDGTVTLAAGANVITVEVTAQDGVTTKTYTVTVTFTPVVTLKLDPDTIDEDAGTAVTVTAKVPAAKTTEFTVTVTAAAVLPAIDAAYTLSANTTLTFAVNATESAGTVTITPVGNTVNERDKVITVSGTLAAGVTGVKGPDDVTLTITDNDHPVINHTLTLHENDADKTLLDPAMIREDVGQVCIRVTATTEADLLPERHDSALVSTRFGTAADGQDYTPVSDGLILRIGAYSLRSGQYVNDKDDCTLLQIVDDAVDEANEQFGLVLQKGSGAPDAYRYEYPPSSPLVVTIIDDDPEPSLSIADAGGAEGEDPEFTVTLDPASGRDVTVDWAVDDGTATAGDDYTDGQGTLIFSVGDTTKTITVATLPDTVPEGDETFTVTLSNPRDATIAGAEATGTIAANDATLSGLAVTYGSADTPATLRPGFASATKSYRAAVEHSVQQVTVTPTPDPAGATIEYLDGSDAALADADSGTPGHQVDLAVGLTTFKVKVTDGTATETFTVIMERDSDQLWGWTPTRDFNNLAQGGLSGVFPEGLWSDGTTLWVLDRSVVLAYTLETQARDNTREISLYDDGTNVDFDIWSDGTTMYVLVDPGDVIRAYALSDGRRQDGTGSTTDREITLHADNDDPNGIWSDGTTIWVSDYGDNRIYAYTLADRTRVSETTAGTTTYPKDVTLHADNDDPGGIWSNGTTLWVVDTTDDKVYAYTLATGSRDTGSEFSLHSENDELGRIWSHGTTMLVPDRVGQKIYTYNSPDLPTLTALSVSYGSPAVTPTLAPGFGSGRLAYTAGVPYNITQVTVAATAADGATATFVQEDGTTAQSDDDSVTSGHQVGLAVGDNVIRVRAVKGGYSQIYTVTVKRAKPAVIVSADAAEAGEGLALSFTVSRSPSAPDSLTVKLDVSETGGLVPSGSEGMKTVLIPANMPSAKYTVTTGAGDDAWDAHSTVTVALVAETDSPYTLGAPNSAQTRVLDDDFPAATAELTVNPATASEGATVTVTVTVTTGSDQMPHEDGGTVTLSTAAVSAQTADYGALSETTFTLAQADFSSVTVGGNSRYQATYTATVGIVDDTSQEGAETFTVSMAQGSDLDAQVTLGTPTSRTITIPANDAPGNAAPTFPATETGARSVAENTASGQNVGSPVAATDTDAGDTLTYSLDGADSGSFTIVSTSGQIQTSAALNYEAKSSYSVTVKVNDGTVNATKAVTISVTDVAEPPDRPAAPTVSAKSGTTDSLDVRWTAPANTGRPAIDDYNLQYRIGSTGSFTSHSFTGTGTSTTIGGLTADTEYEVQVQAHNPEGDSAWSASATARTNASTSTVSSDATLSGLSLSGATLVPPFASGTTGYRASVGNSVASTTVTATTSHASATFVITPADADANANGHQVNLTAGGDTEITVEVTAEDDNATETYTVAVTRAAAQTTRPDGAALVSNTGQSAGSTGGVGTNEWVQSFTTGSNSDGYDLSSIELDFSALPSPALASSDFTVTIWSATAANPPLPGSPLHTLSSPGTFTTGIVAFSASSVVLDPTTTYFVHVANSSGRNARLKRTTSHAEDSGAAPGWSIGNLRYYRLTGTDGAFNDSTALLKLAVRGSAATISNDATLRVLSLVNAADDAAITLTPSFVSATYGYAASVANSVESTTVTATPTHARANAVVTPADADANTAGHQVNLTAGGDTVITAEVTAQDGDTTKTYTVTVTRAAAQTPQSDDATLNELTLSGVTLSPAFAPGTITYTASVANSVESTTVTATASHARATAMVTPADADANTAGHQVNLGVGDTEITAEVTAEDGSAMKTYTVTVTRAPAGASSVATLSELTLSGVTLSPAFASGTITYTASAANSVSATTVTAVTTHDKATRKILIGGVQDLDADVDLAVGDNTITVEVTAEDGVTTKTYTVTVTRAAPAAAAGVPNIVIAASTRLYDRRGGPDDGGYRERDLIIALYNLESDATWSGDNYSGDFSTLDYMHRTDILDADGSTTIEALERRNECEGPARFERNHIQMSVDRDIRKVNENPETRDGGVIDTGDCANDFAVTVTVWTGAAYESQGRGAAPVAQLTCRFDGSVNDDFRALPWDGTTHTGDGWYYHEHVLCTDANGDLAPDSAPTIPTLNWEPPE